MASVCCTTTTLHKPGQAAPHPAASRSRPAAAGRATTRVIAVVSTKPGRGGSGSERGAGPAPLQAGSSNADKTPFYILLGGTVAVWVAAGALYLLYISEVHASYQRIGMALDRMHEDRAAMHAELVAKGAPAPADGR
ncbi:hypothetical protein ABPG75_013904 [Micractinium tetrahymenae]